MKLFKWLFLFLLLLPSCSHDNKDADLVARRWESREIVTEDHVRVDIVHEIILHEGNQFTYQSTSTIKEYGQIVDKIKTIVKGDYIYKQPMIILMSDELIAEGEFTANYMELSLSIAEKVLQFNPWKILIDGE